MERCVLEKTGAGALPIAKAGGWGVSYMKKEGLSLNEGRLPDTWDCQWNSLFC